MLQSIAMPFFNQHENVQKQKPVYVHVYVARYAYIRNLANLARLVKKVRLQPCYVQEYPIFVSLKTPAKKDNKQLFDEAGCLSSMSMVFIHALHFHCQNGSILSKIRM